jgi:hypothetical protein
VSNLESFFGGGSSGTPDGFPPTPAGNSLESTGHTRFYPIASSVDSIRVPQSPFSAGTATLGYRREDATGSGGASEWLIDWTAIAAFTGWTLTTLDDAKFHTSCIRSGKIYIGFYDAANAGSGGAVSYICRADLTTGAIEAVTLIDSAAISTSVIPAASVAIAMDGTVDDCVFWDISSTGNLRMAFKTSGSALTSKGISFVELQSDFATVVTEVVYFDYASTFGFSVPSNKNVAYFADDLSFFLTGDTTDIKLVVPSHGVISIASSTNESFIMQGQSMFAAMVSTEFSATVNVFHHVTDTAIEIRRHMTSVTSETNGERAVTRMEVNRAEIDNYGRELAEKYAGIIL